MKPNIDSTLTAPIFSALAAYGQLHLVGPAGAPGLPAAGTQGYGVAGNGANFGGPLNRRAPR